MEIQKSLRWGNAFPTTRTLFWLKISLIFLEYIRLTDLKENRFKVEWDTFDTTKTSNDFDGYIVYVNDEFYNQTDQNWQVLNGKYLYITKQNLDGLLLFSVSVITLFYKTMLDHVPETLIT